MAKNKLFSLFDEKLRAPSELVSSPSQNLDSLGGNVENSDTLLKKIRQFEEVRPKVDYSDFSNFVFFNSALDYFNITGEKILNEYPSDGTTEQIQSFVDALDDYQRYVVSVWPNRVGHLRFNPSSGFAFVSVDDVGKEEGVTKTSILSPNTGSLSIEFWTQVPAVLTGSNDVMVIAQKVTGSGDGYSVFLSGAYAHFHVKSGSTTDSVSASLNPGYDTYFCFVYDRSSTSPIVSSFTGSSSTFPVLASYSTGSIAGSVDAGSSRFYMGSGSLSGKVVRPFTGSLDDVRLWKEPKTIEDLSSSFNAKIFAQDSLYGLWRFNESGSTTNSFYNSLVFDSSGRKLTGVIQNYYSGIRGSGSVIPYDIPDLTLTLDAPDVASYITEQQTSGSLYDRENDNLITNLLPEQFFILEDIKQTEVLKNFLYVLGRHFDQMKVAMDQFTNVLRVNYGLYDQVPDALLQDVAGFFGWEFTGNFLNKDVVQYILGKQVLSNTESNKHIDTKLYEIKNEFWKRTLLNLMHIYKTKGTRESVETLLRIYGVNKNFVRLKEYGYKPNAGIQTFRINADKSVPVLTFGSGSAVYTNRVVSRDFTGSLGTIETRVRFPTATTQYLTSSLATGSIWTVNSGSTMLQRLFYTKTEGTSQTGSLVYTGSEGSFSLSSVPIFNNEWYNIAVVKIPLSSSMKIEVRSVENGEIVYHNSATLSTTPVTSSRTQNLWLGSTGSLGSQYWMQEARVWLDDLNDGELDDHTLNFQSFGTFEVNGLPQLSLHWRLDENISASAGGELYNRIYDYSGQNISGSGYGFLNSLNPYRKFLLEYNYIAPPEMGWNEDKIRSIDASVVSPEDAFKDNPVLALEFNLVDALNEDMSQVLATLDGFNESIGLPPNRYRDSYPDLNILRENYFKRLQGSVNFRVFIDLLEFFDRSFIDMVRRLLPARAVFLGDEIVVESHMLERPKLQWNYRRREREFQPEGVIRVYIRS